MTRINDFGALRGTRQAASGLLRWKVFVLTRQRRAPGRVALAIPVTWIENQKLLGAQTYAALHAAWQRAETHKAGVRGASGQASYRRTV